MHEYATLLELKEALSIENGATFADGDASRALTAASRALDKMCGRRFYADDDALQVRYYTPFVGDLLPIDDLLVVTAVDIDSGDGTFSTSWSASADFILEPLNAAADGEPWTLVIPRARLPLTTRSVRVTGQFGWSEVPAPIVQATLLLASKLMKRAREAPFGVVTAGFDVGAAIRIGRDPDVALLVQDYVRNSAVIA